MRPGLIRQAVVAKIRPNRVIRTLADGTIFRVREVNDDGVLLRLGEGSTLLIRWDWLYASARWLDGRGWVLLDNRWEPGMPGTLDWYLKKRWVKAAVSTYLAPILYEAGVVDSAQDIFVKLRLRPELEAEYETKDEHEDMELAQAAPDLCEQKFRLKHNGRLFLRRCDKPVAGTLGKALYCADHLRAWQHVIEESETVTRRQNEILSTDRRAQ